MNGPKANAAPIKAAFGPCPPGYTGGAAGQLVMADHDMIFAMFAEIRPAIAIKRVRKPSGDEF